MARPTNEEDPRGAISALAELRLAELAGWTPTEHTALLRLGRASLQRGEWAAACGLLDYAVLLDPGAPDTWELVAGVRMAGRRWAEALAALELAFSLERSWRRAAVAALCCERLGDAVRAKRWRGAARAEAPADEQEQRRMARALAPGEQEAS